VDTILQKTTSAPSDSGKDLGLAVADAVWVGTALLHELYPSRSQFSIAEIVESVLANHLTPGTPTSIRREKLAIRGIPIEGSFAIAISIASIQTAEAPQLIQYGRNFRSNLPTCAIGMK